MALTINPVLSRELRERFRGRRPYVVIAVFLLVLTLATYLVVQHVRSDSVGNLSALTSAGRTTFETLILVLVLLVTFFVPGIAAGSIAGERERRTLSALQVTLLRPGQVVLGKVGAAMSFVLLLLVAALPFAVTAYLLGGIDISTAVTGLVIVAVVGLLLTLIVIGVTVRSRRTQSATMLGYGVALVVLIGGPLLYLVADTVDRASGTDYIQAPPALAALSPVSIVSDVTTDPNTRKVGTAPLSVIADAVDDAWRGADGGWLAVFPEEPGPDIGDRPFPSWLVGLIPLTVVAGLLTWRATRALHTPAETDR